MKRKMKREEILTLCASNPDAMVSYIESLEFMRREKFLKLCALNPEAIVSYIESLEPRFYLDLDFDPPKRPDCSLDLYKRTSDFEIVGFVYNFKPINAYAQGYLDAAKKLVKAVKREKIVTGGAAVYTLGYPIFYLFSHYLELTMKEIISKGENLIPNININNIVKTHDLNSLWVTCEEIVQNMNWYGKFSHLSEDAKAEHKMDYRTIGHFIKMISQDKHSQAFRYPDNKKGKLFLVDNPHMLLNISVLSDVMDWLSYMLDGISDGIDEESSNNSNVLM